MSGRTFCCMMTLFHLLHSSLTASAPVPVVYCTNGHYSITNKDESCPASALGSCTQAVEGTDSSATFTQNVVHFHSADDDTADDYGIDQDCYWSLYPSSTTQIAVVFRPQDTGLSIDIEGHATCAYDYLTVFSGPETCVETPARRTDPATCDKANTIQLENSVSNDQIYKLCGTIEPTVGPLTLGTAQSTQVHSDQLGYTWYFHSDYSEQRRGFLGEVYYYTPFRLVSFPTTVSTCTDFKTATSSSEEPHIQLLDYKGADSSESYTVTVSIATVEGNTNTIYLAGNTQEVTSSSSGAAAFEELAICGGVATVTLKFTSNNGFGFEYTHPTAIEVTSGAPAQVTSLSLTSASSTSLSVEWVHPADNGNTITGCEVAWFTGDASAETSCTASTTACPVSSAATYVIGTVATPLVAGSSYYVRLPLFCAVSSCRLQVQCSNSLGAGDWSAYLKTNTLATASTTSGVFPAITVRTAEAATITIYGNFNRDFDDFECRWLATDDSGWSATTSVTAESDSVITCLTPAGPTITCVQRAVRTTFSIRGGGQANPATYDFMFYVGNDDCNYVDHISVNEQCVSGSCTQTMPEVGGSKVHIYDNTITDTNWDWLFPNYVDKQNMICEFAPPTGAATTSYASYIVPTGTSPANIVCFAPSLAAQTVSVSLSLDGGQNFIRSTSASQSASELTYTPCGTGYAAESIGVACTECTSGYYASSTSSTACIGCTTGRYTSFAGSSSCSDCLAGRYSSFAGGIECTSCPEGYHQPLSVQSFCTACTIGMYASYSGSLECTSCQDGKYSPTEGASTCLDCAVGYFSSQADPTICESCAAGKHQSQTGQSDCDECSVGEYSQNSGAQACTLSSVGYHVAQTNSASQVACEAGFFAITTAASECESCTAGKYSASQAATSCQDCAVGYFSSQAAATVCSSCAEGKYANVTGLTSCTLCEAGKYGPGHGLVNCLVCGTGYYSNSTASTSCFSCPSSATTLATESASYDTCVCEAAYYCSANCNESQYAVVCETCMEGATCRAGKVPLAKRDYWMGSSGDEVYECYNKESCVGGDDTSRRADDTAPGCAEGGTGPICLSCIDGYAMDMTYLCAKCPDGLVPRPPKITVTITTISVGVFIGAIGLGIAARLAQELGKNFATVKHKEMKEKEELEKEVLRLQTSVAAPKLLSMLHRKRQQRFLDEALEGATDMQNTMLHHAQRANKAQTELRSKSRLRDLVTDSTSLDHDSKNGSCSPVLICKVFWSALQVLRLARRFDFKWPGYLKTVFEYQETVTGGNTFLIDCLFPQTMDVIYERVLFIVLLPLVLCLIAAVVYLILYLKRLRSLPQMLPDYRIHEGSVTSRNAAVLPLTYAEKAVYAGLLLPEVDEPEIDFLKRWPTAHVEDTAEDTTEDGLRASFQLSALSNPDRQDALPENEIADLLADVPAFVAKMKSRLSKKYSNDLILTMLVWGFIIWPLVVTEVLSLFSCYYVDNHFYVFGQTEVECYTGDHMYWIFAIGVPGLVLSFGFPLLIYRALENNRESILVYETVVTRKYAFFFADFTPLRYYWEVVIMLRKLGSVFSAVCLVSAGVQSQALCSLAVIVIAIVAHIQFRPFDHWLVDRLETFSLVTCFITLYFGVYLQMHPNGGFAVACSVCILTTQLLFLAFFLFALQKSLSSYAHRSQVDDGVPEGEVSGCCAFWINFVKRKVTCRKKPDHFAQAKVFMDHDAKVAAEKEALANPMPFSNPLVTLLGVEPHQDKPTMTAIPDSEFKFNLKTDAMATPNPPQRSGPPPRSALPQVASDQLPTVFVYPRMNEEETDGKCAVKKGLLDDDDYNNRIVYEDINTQCLKLSHNYSELRSDPERQQERSTNLTQALYGGQSPQPFGRRALGSGVAPTTPPRNQL